MTQLPDQTPSTASFPGSPCANKKSKASNGKLGWTWERGYTKHMCLESKEKTYSRDVLKKMTSWDGHLEARLYRLLPVVWRQNSICHILTLPEHISSPVEHDTVCLVPIPACPSALLVIVLHGLADTVVNHEADIRLVNTHTKGDSSYNNLKKTKIKRKKSIFSL